MKIFKIYEAVLMPIVKKKDPMIEQMTVDLKANVTVTFVEHLLVLFFWVTS